MYIMKRLFIILVAFFCMSCMCCDDGFVTLSAKEFLFQHPNIKIQFDGGEWFDKYTPAIMLGGDFNDAIAVIKIDDEEYEILIDKTYQQIGDTNFSIAYCSG